jgi:hypothetical protein
MDAKILRLIYLLAMKDDLKPVSLPENVIKELDAIVARADKELKAGK